jgi:putative FmdB family regulatory protein
MLRRGGGEQGKVVGEAMPIYEFRCTQCREEFEELVMGDCSGVECPKCHTGGVEKLMSVCSFKGSGETGPSSAKSSCSSCAATSCSTCR